MAQPIGKIAFAYSSDGSLLLRMKTANTGFSRPFWEQSTMKHVELDELLRLFGDEITNNSFADVGGLWGTTGEMVTFAHHHEASSLTMIDHAPFGDDLWAKFGDRLSAHGIDQHDVDCRSVDVESPQFLAHPYRVVYCNGLLYHTPHPFRFLQQLSAVTTHCLLLGSIHSGRCDATHDAFVPGYTLLEIAQVQEQYAFPSDAPSFGISVVEDKWMFANNIHNARPFWWLLSKHTIERMLDLVGFDVQYEADDWDGRVVKYLCFKRS